MTYTRFTFSCLRRLCEKNKLKSFIDNGYTYSKLSKILRSELNVTFKYCGNRLYSPSKAHFCQTSSYSTYNRDTTTEFSYIAREIGRLKTVSNDEVSRILRGVQVVGRNLSEANFDATFLEVCRLENFFSIGKDFFLLLYSQNKCNVATIGKFFRLCYDFSGDCSEDDKTLLIKIFDDLVKKHPILDARTCENVALGLAITKDWRRGLQLLKMCHLSSSSPSLKMYSALIETAFINNDFSIAQDLLHEMVRNNKDPPSEVYKAWLESSEHPLTTFYEIMRFIENYNIHIKGEITDLFVDFFKKNRVPIKNWSVTNIHHTGYCQNCRRTLKAVDITEDEFKKLRDAFLNPVLFGKNIFLKTKPDELNLFFGFLKRIDNVDVVLDGLNIAYSKDRKIYDPKISSLFLRQVVQYFVKHSKKVAVIGRKHMNSWPKNNMDYIKQKSHLFLAENVSEDDPFLLYTTMHCGLGTCFVSRDQMRSHKFLLKGSELDQIFSRWQQIHQYHFQHLSPEGTVKLSKPSPYLRSPQESEPGVWHLPLSTPLEGVPGHLIANKTKWLCLE